MSLKKKTRFYKTVVFRLTVLYTVLFTILVSFLFIISHALLSKNLMKKADSFLLIEAHDIEGELYEEGIEGLTEEIGEEAFEEGVNRVFFRFFSADGEEIASSDLRAWKYLDKQELKKQALRSFKQNPVYHVCISPDPDFDARVISYAIAEGTYILQIGISIKDDELLLQKYLRLFVFLFPVMLLCGVIIGLFVSSRMIKGVKKITSAAERFGQDRFDERITMPHAGEEIERLADAYNRMLDRIVRLMSDLREVTNNIAHDLRTPLTRIRGVAETTLSGTKDIHNVEDALGTITEEADNLVHLINIMLEIAEAEAGFKPKKESVVMVNDVARKVHELFMPVAQTKHIHFSVQVPDTMAALSCNLERFQRVIANLVDNALKFTPEGGNVSIHVSENEEDITFSVRDTGIGIDSAHLPHIFKKFYRVDPSRSQPGNGLGLSWSQAIITSMGGSISVDSIKGQGSTFIVILPLIPSS